MKRDTDLEVARHLLEAAARDIESSLTQRSMMDYEDAEKKAPFIDLAIGNTEKALERLRAWKTTKVT